MNESVPRLLALPAELRNKVNEYASGDYDLGFEPGLEPQAFALLRVKHQTNAETTFLPYSLNKFSFYCVDALKDFLNLLTQPQKRAISFVCLGDCGVNCWPEPEEFSCLEDRLNLKGIELTISKSQNTRYGATMTMDMLEPWVRGWRPTVKVIIRLKDGR